VYCVFYLFLIDFVAMDRVPAEMRHAATSYGSLDQTLAGILTDAFIHDLEICNLLFFVCSISSIYKSLPLKTSDYKL
jgi:hypothetical protein